MKHKFQEVKGDEILHDCRRVPADKDPDLLTIPPFHSIKHKREWGFTHVLPDGQQFALIFYWEDPGQEEQRSIRWFYFDGIRYRLRWCIPLS